MSRITGSEVANMMEAYNAVYAPQQEEVVEEVEDLQEIGVNFGGQAAVDKARAQVKAQSASDSRIAALRQQRFGSGGAPSASAPTAKTAPTAPAKPAASQYTAKNLGAAQYAAFKGGGGDAAIKQGYSAGEVVARGRAALNKADGGPRPAAPAPAARPAAPAAPARPAAQAPSTKTTPSINKPSPSPVIKDGSKPSTPAPAATPARTFNPLMQRTFGYQTGNAPDQIAKASAGAPSTPSGSALGAAANQDVRKKLNLPAKNLTQGFDIFDIIKGYLLDEGYAETEEAALAIMANMSEGWKKSIIEG